jgi:hypothetical protein
MDKACCSETSFTIYPSTRRRTPEELKLELHLIGNAYFLIQRGPLQQVSCAAYEIADQSVITQATSRNRVAVAE